MQLVALSPHFKEFEIADKTASGQLDADRYEEIASLINGRNDSAPLVSDLMKIGMTIAAEENFDLHAGRCRIAPSDLGGCRRRYQEKVGFHRTPRSLDVSQLSRSGEQHESSATDLRHLIRIRNRDSNSRIREI